MFPKLARHLWEKTDSRRRDDHVLGAHALAAALGAFVALAGCDRGAVMPEADASTTWFEGRIVRTSRGQPVECWVAYGRERCQTQAATVVTDLVEGRVCTWSPRTAAAVVLQVPRLGGPPIEGVRIGAHFRRTERHRMVAGRPCRDFVMVLPDGGEVRACMDDVYRQVKQGQRAAPDDRAWAEGLTLRFEVVGGSPSGAVEVTEVTQLEPRPVPPTRFDCESP